MSDARSAVVEGMLLALLPALTKFLIAQLDTYDPAAEREAMLDMAHAAATERVRQALAARGG